MRELRVEVPGHSYPVYIGAEVLKGAHELIPRPEKAEKLALVCDAGLEGLDGTVFEHLPRLRALSKALGLRMSSLSVRGEASKRVATVEFCWRFLAEREFHRNDLILGAGGGVATDIAGFVAATFNRGMPWVAVPTTLLAMVDASIGGKTAIDLPEGKNLVGAFHHPLCVLADVTVLETLPDGEVGTGMAEAIKHGLIADADLLARIVRDRDAVLARDAAVLESLVADAAAVKVRIVSEDPFERGVRAHLNYGHTIGHALETRGGYERLTHGQAIAIGMMFAAHLAVALGYADRTSMHSDALGAYGLPTGGVGVPLGELLPILRRDKKYERGLRFVVLEDLGKPLVVSDVPQDAVRRAYEAVE